MGLDYSFRVFAREPELEPLLSWLVQIVEPSDGTERCTTFSSGSQEFEVPLDSFANAASKRLSQSDSIELQTSLLFPIDDQLLAWQDSGPRSSFDAASSTTTGPLHRAHLRRANGSFSATGGSLL